MNLLKSLWHPLEIVKKFTLWGGGGGGGTSTQTTVTELPEWAKPYAKDILSKGAALTEQKYTPYEGERYAGLSDLQKTAMSSVSSPQAYGQAVQGYMSPYMQGVVDIQKREAARQSAMLGAQQQGQATGAGAFGGYRDAIQRAERERNLSQQMGDIQERGLQSAFQSAESAFGRNLGAQTQLGALQQEAAQRPLDIAYQDFQNQLNYPYKQLGFMSDLLRGTPTGSSAAMSMYQAPGSMLGQIAGAGMGLYGMSRMFAKEGGLMESYAEGGVTSEQNKQAIIADLSDAQLKQAYQAAMDRRDMEQATMIEQELAQRASMRNGLGSIPVDFSAFMPDEQAMAAGGIVAFANGDLVEDPMFDMIGGSVNPQSVATDRARIEAMQARKAAQEEEERLKFLKTAAPEVYEKKMAERSQPKASAKVEPTAQDRAIMDKAVAEQAAPRVAPAKTPAKSISEAARIVTDVAKTEVPKDDVRELARSITAELNSAPRPEAEALSRMLEKAEKRAEDIKARSVGEALMKFGFGMAAQAAKPGQARRSGLAGALESAAAASPILAESIAENEKLQRAAEDNALKLRMEQARYQSALETGNKQLAATLAGSISQRNLQQATLQEQIEQNRRANALKEKEIAGLAAYRAQSGQTNIQKVADDLQAADPKLSRREALSEASKLTGYSFRSEESGNLKRAELLSKLRNENPLYKALELQLSIAKTPEEQASIQQKLNDIEMRAFGKLGGAGVGSAQAGQTIRFDSKGNQIQ